MFVGVAAIIKGNRGIEDPIPLIPTGIEVRLSNDLPEIPSNISAQTIIETPQ